MLAANRDADTRVRHIRNSEYLAWRYSNPLAQYFYLAAGERELEGYLVAHRSRVDKDDGPTPTTIIDCDANSHLLWADLFEVAMRLLPGGVILTWTRDLSADKLATLARLGFEFDEPSGRVTRDWHLPNLMVRQTAHVASTSPFARLATSPAWDLRGVCGRCWR